MAFRSNWLVLAFFDAFSPCQFTTRNCRGQQSTQTGHWLKPNLVPVGTVRCGHPSGVLGFLIPQLMSFFQLALSKINKEYAIHAHHFVGSCPRRLDSRLLISDCSGPHTGLTSDFRLPFSRHRLVRGRGLEKCADLRPDGARLRGRGSRFGRLCTCRN